MSYLFWCHDFMFTRCILTSGGISPNCGRNLCDPAGLCGSEQNRQSVSQTDQCPAQAIIDQRTKIASLISGAARCVCVKAGNKMVSSSNLYLFIMLKCAASKTVSTLINDKMCEEGLWSWRSIQLLNGYENLLSYLRTKPPHPNPHLLKSSQKSMLSLKANQFPPHKRVVCGKRYKTDLAL